MNTLLTPIMENLDHLSTIGFTFSSPAGVKTVRIKQLFGIFDLIAKAPVLNMKQLFLWNCPTC